MPIVETVSITEKYRKRCEDRVAVFSMEKRSVIVVADGAGGVGSGEAAAETVIKEISKVWKEVHSADEWSRLLGQIDCRITDGQSTVIVIDMRPYGIAGSSVGDSQAWLVREGLIDDLTEKQNRKPLLGTGNAVPVSFTRASFEGILVAGTDGLFDYAKREVLLSLISRSDFFSVPRLCVELVRLPSGEFWDDIGVVAARMKPKPTVRKSYSI